MICKRRLLSLLALVLLQTPAFPQTLSTKGNADAKVLFVCEHGAAKSVIATAHFNKLASEQGLRVRAIARGTNPDPDLSPEAVAGLRSEGLQETMGKPQLVTDKDLSEAKRVVTLGCKLPQNTKATDWNDIPSVSEDYPEVSRAIKNHVEQLVEELSALEPSPSSEKHKLR